MRRACSIIYLLTETHSPKGSGFGKRYVLGLRPNSFYENTCSIKNPVLSNRFLLLPFLLAEEKEAVLRLRPSELPGWLCEWAMQWPLPSPGNRWTRLWQSTHDLLRPETILNYPTVTLSIQLRQCSLSDGMVAFKSISQFPGTPTRFIERNHRPV